MQDSPYSNLGPWLYSALPDFLGAGRGWLAETEDQFNRSLRETAAYTQDFCLVEASLEPLDRSTALDRLAATLAKRV
jgi:indolepyruvate decarboxylase